MGVLLTPLLGSCTSDDVIGGAGREECDIISGQPMTVTSATRATDGRTSPTQFDPGETVWLWANKTNDTYITAWQLTAKSGGSLTGSSAKYWPSDGSSLDVYALHGNFENSTITEGSPSWSNLSLTHTVETDQTLDNNKRLSDLLYSHKSSATPNSTVQLAFDHLLAKITVKLDLDNSKGIESSELNNATVTLTNIQPKATLSNASLTGNLGKTTTTGDRTTISAGKITSSISSGDVIGSAIVPLQNFGGGKGSDSENNVITITLAHPDSRSFSYMPATPVALSAGKEYTYTLRIIGNKITGSLSVSDFISATESISFKDYFDYLADLKNRNYLGSKAKPHDLSYDYNGQMNTANCYVVTHPGYYKFPLVYGNAIKNGATNAIAYGVKDGTSISSTFVNHLDQPITEPYIYDNSGCTVGSAELVWQDALNLISDISLCDEQKYIKFEITKENIEQGNAVIAVKDESGKIMWSWHIWVTNKNVYETVPIKTQALSGLTTSHTYNFMPVPLGWDDDIPEQPNCPYYQWGRKDPLMPSKGIYGNTETKPCYDISGKTVSFAANMSDKTIKGGILYPEKIINSSNANWDTGTTRNDNWNAINGDTQGFNYNEVVKTVYDPSPVGFKMPPPYAFTGFTNSGGNVSSSSNTCIDTTNGYPNGFNEGYNFYTNSSNTTTTYWRACGYRAYNDGSLVSVGSYGYCWSAGPYSNTYGCSLCFNSSYVYPQNGDRRANGFSVRPVSE